MTGTNQRPTSIYDIYEFYLKAEHLRGVPAKVTIKQVSVTEIFIPNLNQKQPRLLVRFVGKKLVLILNKTHAADLARIAGTGEFSKWVGMSVILSPTKTERGKDTISISAVPELETQADETKADEVPATTSEAA